MASITGMFFNCSKCYLLSRVVGDNLVLQQDSTPGLFSYLT